MNVYERGTPDALARSDAATDGCPRCGAPFAGWAFCPRDGQLAQQPALIGERYRLVRLIGEGGMGFVFLATHQLLEKSVAIKVLRIDERQEKARVTRFMREARLSSQLNHQHIIAVLDFGYDPKGFLYLVLEYVDGVTLEQRLGRAAELTLPQAVSILRQLCAALTCAHQAQIVHRDLAPHNVLLTRQGDREDWVKLLDFGISRHMDDSDRVTSTHLTLGTTLYMAPEQLCDEPRQDHRIDLYAWGIIAHQLFTGQLPFAAETSEAQVELKLQQRRLSLPPHPVLTQHPALAELIGDCLEQDPDRRPPSASDIEQRLLGAFPVEPTGVRANDRVGSFRLIRPLGKGGTGVVWLAEHPLIAAKVAIKILHGDKGRSTEALQRFVREAKAVNRIDHPNIVKIFDFGQLADGRPYAVMELLSGETLAQRLNAQGPLPWAECQPIVTQVVAALRAAHRAGIVHRDLKPQHIFLCGEDRAPQVKLIDFGIAQVRDPGGNVDADGQPERGPGTPLYAAPEQATEGQTTAAVDVYALGVMIFEMLSGKPPFTGRKSELMAAKLFKTPPSLVDHARFDGPPKVAQLVHQMLARQPRNRPSLERVETVVGKRAAREGVASSTVRARRWAQVPWRQRGSWLLLAAMLLAVGLFFWWRESPPQAPPWATPAVIPHAPAPLESEGVDQTEQAHPPAAEVAGVDDVDGINGVDRIEPSTTSKRVQRERPRRPRQKKPFVSQGTPATKSAEDSQPSQTDANVAPSRLVLPLVDPYAD